MMQAHHIQRSKSLSNSFAVNRCVVQWDEVTLNHLAWSVIILNASHAAIDTREREVMSCAKLGKDKDGKSKTAKNVKAAVTGAIKEYDMPAKNIDFCVSDTTEYAALHVHPSLCLHCMHHPYCCMHATRMHANACVLHVHVTGTTRASTCPRSKVAQAAARAALTRTRGRGCATKDGSSSS